MSQPTPATPEEALDRLADLTLALGTRQILDELTDLRDLLTREAHAAGLTVPEHHRSQQ